MVSNSQTHSYLQATFRALTDSLVPSTRRTGYESSISVSDMGVHEYLIYALDHYVSIQEQLHHITIPLAYPTAIMLDEAATQLVNTHKAQASPQIPFPEGRMFSRLSRKDRIRTLSALENLKFDLYLLPSPFQNNGGLIKHVVDALNRFSMFGYYSEWPAYGTTRLYPPDDRRLEFFSWGWQQVGYPGVSLGYRDFRGFLLTFGEVKAD